MVKENIDGWMEGSTQENGPTITCMVMVFILGKTGESMKVNISRIKSMAKEHTLGQMDERIVEDGNMGVSTVRDHTNYQLETNAKVFGSKGSDQNGLKTKITNIVNLVTHYKLYSSKNLKLIDTCIVVVPIIAHNF